ncbi:hypothetical protein EON64_11615 [archaeon]|nr:MAG: hypothetical protein EON64_11615 [archaeon]
MLRSSSPVLLGSFRWACQYSLRTSRSLKGLVVGVPKESLEGEHRVALAPAHIAKLKKAGAMVRIEKDAGRRSGFSDESYLAAGAELVSSKEAWDSPVVAKVRPPTLQEAALVQDRMIMSIIQPRVNLDLMKQLVTQKVGTYSCTFTYTSDAHAPYTYPCPCVCAGDSDVSGQPAAHPVQGPGLRRAQQPGQRGRLQGSGGGSAAPAAPLRRTDDRRRKDPASQGSCYLYVCLQSIYCVDHTHIRNNSPNLYPNPIPMHMHMYIHLPIPSPHTLFAGAGGGRGGGGSGGHPAGQEEGRYGLRIRRTRCRQGAGEKPVWCMYCSVPCLGIA